MQTLNFTCRSFSLVLPVFRECSRIAGRTLVRRRTSRSARHVGDAMTTQVSVIFQVPRVHVMTTASVASGTAGGRFSGVDRTPIDRWFRWHSLFIFLALPRERDKVFLEKNIVKFFSRIAFLYWVFLCNIFNPYILI